MYYPCATVYVHSQMHDKNPDSESRDNWETILQNAMVNQDLKLIGLRNFCFFIERKISKEKKSQIDFKVKPSGNKKRLKLSKFIFTKNFLDWWSWMRMLGCYSWRKNAIEKKSRDSWRKKKDSKSQILLLKWTGALNDSILVNWLQFLMGIVLSSIENSKRLVVWKSIFSLKYLRYRNSKFFHKNNKFVERLFFG